MKNSNQLKMGPVAGRVVAFIFALGLSACNHAENGKGPDGSTEGRLPEVAVTFDANGNVLLKDREGKPMGEQCSPDPKSPNVCPMFKPGHKVQVEQASDLLLVRYSGSPQCVTVRIGSNWYVLPSVALCNP